VLRVCVVVMTFVDVGTSSTSLQGFAWSDDGVSVCACVSLFGGEGPNLAYSGGLAVGI